MILHHRHFLGCSCSKKEEISISNTTIFNFANIGKKNEHDALVDQTMLSLILANEGYLVSSCKNENILEEFLEES